MSKYNIKLLTIFVDFCFYTDEAYGAIRAPRPLPIKDFVKNILIIIGTQMKIIKDLYPDL